MKRRHLLGEELMGRIQIVESTLMSPQSGGHARKLLEEYKGDIDAIYPEIRVITAARVTRNKTYYPAESLIGDSAIGNGIYSLLEPYPKPIIKDHNAVPGMLGGDTSPVYGRVKYAKFVSDGGGGGYVSVVPEISDPYAIQMILSERFLTVSIGIETSSVKCSICGAEEGANDSCTHIPGNIYIIDGTPKECYRVIGPVWFEEISFVTIPSDTTARVISKSSTQNESIPLLGVRSLRDGDISIKGKEERFALIKESWNRNKDVPPPRTIVAQAGTPPVAAKSSIKGMEDDAIGVNSEPSPIKPNISSSLVASESLSSVQSQEAGVENTDNKNGENNETDLESENSDITLKESNMKKPEVETSAISNTVAEGGATGVTETLESLQKVKESLLLEIASYKEQIASFEDKCLELANTSHKRLAMEVAILSKILRKAVSRNKTTEEFAKELRKRTTHSLEDTLEDLLAEFGDSAPVDITRVEKVASPVIKTDETQAAQAATEKLVEESKDLGTVGDIEETPSDSVYAYFRVISKPSTDSATPAA